VVVWLIVFFDWISGVAAEVTHYFFDWIGGSIVWGHHHY